MTHRKTPEKHLAKARARADQARRAKGVPRRPSFDDRVAEKTVAIPFSGCVVWTGFVNRHGYGQTYLEGKPARVHRAVWEREFGPIPSGLGVLHECDVPCCVNLDHLFIGTQQDNMADMVSKGRGAKGEHQGAARLTANQVRKIRASSAKLTEIASEFGISTSTASQIRNGHRWRHLE